VLVPETLLMGFIGRNRRKVKDLLFRMDTRDGIVKRIPRQYRAYCVIAAGVCLQFSYGGLVYSFVKLLLAFLVHCI
jgi:hypothetical protein